MSQSPAASQTQLDLRPRSADADVPGPKKPREKYIRLNGEKLDVFAVARGEEILVKRLTPAQLLDCGLTVKAVNGIMLYVYERQLGVMPAPPAGFWV